MYTVFNESKVNTIIIRENKIMIYMIDGEKWISTAAISEMDFNFRVPRKNQNFDQVYWIFVYNESLW